MAKLPEKPSGQKHADFSDSLPGKNAAPFSQHGQIDYPLHLFNLKLLPLHLSSYFKHLVSHVLLSIVAGNNKYGKKTAP